MLDLGFVVATLVLIVVLAAYVFGTAHAERKKQLDSQVKQLTPASQPPEENK